ncbi:MAG: Rossmann-like domain-containing protein, partial [Anaerolineales bacterium]
LLGPTTPLSPMLFEMGVTVLSGSVVEQPLPVVNGVIEDAGFRKLRKMGIRLVSMVKDDLPIQ